MTACSSSSSKPISPLWRYHVFLSFRGEDSRHKFTDHLYATLCRKGIITFKDDEELEKGEVIKHQLLQAIEESLCSIVIISQNYASSTWCLDELQKILESREALGRGVLPIFYDIDPSIVRHQTGSFAKAFTRHAERYGEGNNKVQKWRDALSQVANLSGYHTKNWSETKLIEEIITVLWRKVKPNLPSYINDGLVGIDAKLEEMYQILEIGSLDVRFVGIWGMGGIGKTTLAKYVFNQFRSHFDICCCLENVREKSTTIDGLLGLQIELLTKLKIRNLEIDNLDQGKAMIRNLLFHRKVLLLLDDIDDIRQLEHLAGKQDWFGQGSRVIITTRDMHLLESHEAPFRKYKIKVLDTDESLELFCQKAFKRNRPEEGFLELSQSVVQYAEGLPLALKVLGLHLCARDISLWEDALKKIRKDPPKNILDTLRISYEALEDAEKTLFLDIACFFNRWQENRVMQILKNCGFNPKIGIAILIERSLLTCDCGFFYMHDMLQEMGRKIVIQKSGNELNKQSRLWTLDDVDEVLGKNKGTEFIQAIVLRTNNYEAHWDPKALSKMCNLRIFIVFDGLHLKLPLGLKCLSNSTKVFEWKEFPLPSLPLGEKLDKLVELKMCQSKIKHLWSGSQNFENLKFIDLSYSEDLIETPIFFGVPNLESLILEGCSNVVEIHQSLGKLKKLVVLNLKDCLNLKRLPSRLETNSLKHFILSGCLSLKKLPEFGENMEGISELHLSGCKSVICLPNSICNLKSLRILNIFGCSRLQKLPDLGENIALERLDLSGCSGLASNSFYKPRLLGGKFRRHTIPMSLTMSALSRLSMLRNLDVSFCNLTDGSIPDDLSCLSSLEKINLSGNNFAHLPPHCISNLSRLWKLDLSFCPKLQLLPMFPQSLRKASATNCGLMEGLPDKEIWKLFMFDEMNLPEPQWFGMIERREYVISIPGSEIPSWFDNDKRKNFPLRNSDFVLDFNARLSQKSIIVDIPDHCRSNNCKWWGIVVCFLFEPCAEPRDHMFEVCCNFASPETVECPRSPTRWHRLGDKSRGLNLRHQFIIFFNGDDDHIQEVLRRGHKQVKMYFYTTGWYNDIKMSKCGWRVICKDEVWSKAITGFENMPSGANHLTALEKARLTEISLNEEDGTAAFTAQKTQAKDQKILDDERIVLTDVYENPRKRMTCNKC